MLHDVCTQLEDRRALIESRVLQFFEVYAQGWAHR
jgi:hypothetical protein